MIAFEAAKAAGLITAGPVVELALLLMGPAGAYLGFRTLDKWRAK